MLEVMRNCDSLDKDFEIKLKNYFSNHSYEFFKGNFESYSEYIFLLYQLI